jgi:hypothetical protein
MAKQFPDKAYRVLQLDDKERERQSVIIGLHRSDDDFTQFSVSSYGFGQPAFLTPCVSLRALDLSNPNAINEELERVVCQMELNGYDLVSDTDMMVHELPEIFDSVKAPAWSTAEDYYTDNESVIDSCQLVEVPCGLRIWLVIDDNVQFIDAKTLKRIHISVSQYSLDALRKSFKNDANGRTILETFASDGSILITDAIRLKGSDVSQERYSAVLRKLQKALPDTFGESHSSEIKLGQPVALAEHALKILANSDSALRPALYAKHDRSNSVIIDRYRGFEVQFAQQEKGVAKLNYIDFEFTAECTQMPIQTFPAFDNEYTSVGLRPGTDRIPLLF